MLRIVTLNYMTFQSFIFEIEKYGISSRNFELKRVLNSQLVGTLRIIQRTQWPLSHSQFERIAFFVIVKLLLWPPDR